MEQSLVVMKFGGTSVVPPEAVQASIACVRACVDRGERPVVVVSAPAGVTDLLKAFADHPRIRMTSALIEETARALVRKFEAYRVCIPLDVSMERYVHHLLPTLMPEPRGIKDMVNSHEEDGEECAGPHRPWETNHPLESLHHWFFAHLKYGASFYEEDERTAFLLSLGEHASAPLFAFAMSEAELPACALYTSMCLHTAETPMLEAEPSENQGDLAYRIHECLSSDSHNIPVVTGFVGYHGNSITLLGRGGSDYTASIVAEAIRATRVEIYTDVDGVFTADPRIVHRGARVIPRIGYKTATEFAGFGAKVLHPKTILPAIRAGIAVHVKNTFHPDAPGTIIVSDDQMTDDERSGVKGIAVRKGMHLFLLRSPTMIGSIGYLGSALRLFGKHRFDIDYISSSEATITLTAVGGDTSPSALVEELGAFVRAEYKETVAVVTYVHEGHEILEEHTQSLGDLTRQGIPVRGATFDEDGHFQLLVDLIHADEVVRILHAYLISSVHS